jgi:DNA-binding CsgD family transcriptional regulator
MAFPGETEVTCFENVSEGDLCSAAGATHVVFAGALEFAETRVFLRDEGRADVSDFDAFRGQRPSRGGETLTGVVELRGRNVGQVALDHVLLHASDAMRRLFRLQQEQSLRLPLDSMPVQGDIVGRGEELARLAAFIERVSGETGVLVLEGWAGIGKSRLWRAGLDLARASGHRVLSARASGGEMRLAFAGAADLLANCTDLVLGNLPGPQRHALAVALQREEAGMGPPDEHALFAGFLEALRILSSAGPVLVAVDDLHWLDGATAQLLEYAVRRLGPEPIGVLATFRRERDEALPTEFLRAVEEARLERVKLGPLTIAAIHELVRTRAGVNLPRPTLLRLHEMSAGNPLFALHLAEALTVTGTVPRPADRLPISRDLSGLIRARLGRLSPAARQALLTAAACASPTVTLLGSEALPALDEAVTAGVVEVVEDQIRFTHPLLASVLYDEEPPGRRRELHRQLAALITDTEERARHLALAATGPDAGVAAELEGAAARARSRGAPQAAAELLQRAEELTPATDPTGRRRRRSAAALAAYEAGDQATARSLLESLAAGTLPGPDRAEVLLQLGTVLEGEDYDAACVALEQAEREAGDDDVLRARALAALGGFMYILPTGIETAERRARQAVGLAEATGDERTLAHALGKLASILLFRGHGLQHDLFQRAVALEERTGPVRIQEDGGPSIIYAEALVEAGEHRAARERLAVLTEQGHRFGDAGLAYPLFLLAVVDYMTGDWAKAEVEARQALDFAVETGRETLQVLALSAVGWIEGGRGEVHQARAHLAEALSLAEHGGRGGRFPRGVLGLLELSLADNAAAWGWLEQAVAHIVGVGMAADAEQVADGIEALAGLGRLTEARELLERFDTSAARTGFPWARAAGARCHGVVAAAAGDLETAQAALEQAVELGEPIGRPLELGRSLLELGSVRRRQRRKAAARATLERAAAIFGDLGAALWADRARRELGRIGGRIPYLGSLSATEEQIAELVRSGQTNREIAEALHLSRKTVEGSLTKIYRKLGMRSRTELAGASRNRAPQTGSARPGRSP